MRRPERDAERVSTAPELALREGQDVLGLPPDGVLGFVVERRRQQEAAAAEELRGVTAWADLHRIGDPDAEGYGSVDPDVHAQVVCEEQADLDAGRGPRSFAGPDGIEGRLRLSGENAYLVAEFAVCELAAGLRMSETAARAYVGQALELRDRLPRLWGQVMEGRLPAWKARRVAEQTISCTDQAASWVDAQLEAFAHKLSLRRIEACVEAAILRFEPERAAERAAQAAERRGVWTEELGDGTATVTACADTPGVLAFDRAVGEVAASLAALGDVDPLQVRRSKALGVLADPQHALDLDAAAAAPRPDDKGRRPARRRTPLGQPLVHVHVHLSVAEGALGGANEPLPGGAAVSPGSVARVHAPGVSGPRSIDAVRRWLSDLAPGSPLTVTPVVDPAERIAVDAYEVPARIARQVEHRDVACVFPWCGRQGRFDLDHIEEYVPPDEGGPPGQTATDNLARLCRFHHRVKTHGDWDYRRQPDGSLTWTSALGRRYRVDHTGTTRLDAERFRRFD